MRLFGFQKGFEMVTHEGERWNRRKLLFNQIQPKKQADAKFADFEELRKRCNYS
jgi:hypothetical protein